MNYSNLYQNKPQYYYDGKNDGILNYLPDGLSIVLDVGCSSGGFGKLLKDRGLTVWGVEPNTKAAHEAESRVDHVINNIFDETILDLIQDQKFDCIFFIDVLEHFTDPYSAIDLCKKMLRPNGYIISAIPNVLQYGNILKILKNQDWEYVEAGIMDKTHLRFFSKKSIVRLFEEKEFEIVHIDGIYTSCSILFRLINLLLFNKLESMKYVHFITVARLRNRQRL